MNNSSHNSILDQPPIEEPEIIAADHYIDEKSPNYKKIEFELRGEMANGYDSLRKRSIYANFRQQVDIFKLIESDTYLMRNRETKKFMDPLEVSIFLRECNNRRVNTPKGNEIGRSSINFIQDLQCNPTLINSEFKVTLDDKKLTELANIANQQFNILDMKDKPVQDIAESLEVFEEIARLHRELLKSKQIKVINDKTIKSREEYAKSRLDKANGLKKDKNGNITKISNKESKAQLRSQLVAKFGESKVKYFEATKQDINDQTLHVKYDEFIKSLG